MLDFKKKVSLKPLEELSVSKCPICASYVCHAYYMQDSKSNKKSKWFSCSCGVVYNSQKPSRPSKEPQKYNIHKVQEYQYPVRIYSPLIEELIYGRRVLIINPDNSYQEEAFKERGWVPTVIKDFETHQFSEVTKYNLIWLYHSLESMLNPVGSLELCKKILAEDGILFIGAVDTDFINTRSSSCFIHWKHDQNFIMWNRKSITSHLEKLGFNVILARQNYEHRFPYWDDIHLIAQKKFF